MQKEFYPVSRQPISGIAFLHTVRSIFVATILIFFTVFGIGFIAAGFIDGYNVAVGEPFDYTISTSADKPEITEQQILMLAAE